MSYIIDLHCHPALKTYLFDRSISVRNDTHPDFGVDSIAQMQVDLPKMIEANVFGIISATHLPERKLLKYSKTLHNLYPFIEVVFPGIANRIEFNQFPQEPFYQTRVILDRFETEVSAARVAGFDVEIVRTYADFKKRLDEGKLAIVHSVEGAHSLGTGHKDENQYLYNVSELFKRGVCMMTLAHLYPNDIAPSVEGLPPDVKKLLKCSYRPDPSAGLTPVGQKVVEHMLNIGMLVDLTHSTPQARKDVYKINNDRGAGKRPLVFSHVGVNAQWKVDMNPTDEELHEIAASNGVIGVILMNYWLAGHIDTSSGYDPGIDYIVKTVEYIAAVTGSYDHIAIGSDFDGFGDPPDDVQDTSRLGRIREALGKSIIGPDAEENIDKVMYKNVHRVLAEGWKG